MMKLYVANLTRQSHEFLYRVPESIKIHSQLIVVGRQVQVWRDDQPEIIVSVIGQHTRYGMMHVKKLASRTEFCGLCYDHKPIAIDAILAALDENARRQVEAAAAERKAMALATKEMIERETRLRSRSKLRRFSMSTIEQIESITDPAGFEEVVSVEIEGVPPDPGRGW